MRRDYREDIDWLRAIAVLAVVAFHFEAPAVFKQNGRYYVLGSHRTGWNTNDNEYTSSTSLSPSEISPETVSTDSYSVRRA